MSFLTSYMAEQQPPEPIDPEKRSRLRECWDALPDDERARFHNLMLTRRWQEYVAYHVAKQSLRKQ